MILHNEILDQFLEDYSKSVYGRQLISKVSMSQKAISLELNRLEKENVLKSKTVGNIKYFSLNIKNNSMKDILITAELSRKRDFLDKHKVLSNIFKQDDRIIGIFGSYAKDTQTDESDIDIFIVGNKQSDDYVDKCNLFDLKISIKYFSKEEFSRPSSLVKEVINNHVVLFNAEHFVDMLWRDFYGFD